MIEHHNAKQIDPPKDNRAVRVQCNRCHDVIDGIQDDDTTGGFYIVALNSFWNKYARPNETVVCDPCMHADPDYVRDFGGTTS